MTTQQIITDLETLAAGSTAIAQDATNQAALLASVIEQLRNGGPMPAPTGIPFASEFRLPFDTDKVWYEATRRFPPYNYHPDRCEDWNLESGANTDLGEPLYAPFSGVVLSANDWGGGVGRVVQILGVVAGIGFVVWSGWHLHTMHTVGTVQVGQQVGSIGNADGRYAGAHLHEQICIVNEWGIPAPTTFASDGRYDWQQPSAFYVAHGVDVDLVARVAAYDGN